MQAGSFANTPSKKPEELVIIGGGLEGCLAAIFAARLRDPYSGRPKYHITLLEKQDKLLNGASLIASRLHLGGEYPLDPQTGFDCLKGAVIWKLLMPQNIYTDRSPMKFTVSKETEAEGKKGPLNAQGKKTLTLQKYLDYYETIREKYEEHYNKIKKKFLRETPGLLFGSPEQGKFYRKLTADDYKQYDGDIAGQFHSEIAGGFQSQEPGLNPPLYLSAIEHLLLQQKNIDVRLGSGVKEVKKINQGSQAGQFQINFEDGRQPVIADQVIQAAWEENLKISKDAKETTACNRTMIFMALDKPQKIDPIFIMLREHGGMLSSYDDKHIIGYRPTMDKAYLRGEKKLTHDDPEIPKEWSIDPLAKDVIAWFKNYSRSIGRFFPVIRKVGFHPCLFSRITLNFDDEHEKRRHSPTEERAPGHFIMAATKVTLAPQSALEAVEMLQKRSKSGKNAPLIKVAEIGDPLDMALEGNYSLRELPDAQPNVTRARLFAFAHPPLEPGLVPDVIPGRYRTSGFHGR